MPKRNPILPYDRHPRQRARDLRNHSTLSEVLLWQKLKGQTMGVEFHRQVPIDHYIVDFYCHELRLALEIDGSSHHDKPEADARRQENLERLGVQFLRFDDLNVKKRMAWVLTEIEEWVRVRTSPSSRT